MAPLGASQSVLKQLGRKDQHGALISTLHRVVPPPSGSTGAARRRSIARFLDCPPDLVVETIPSCIDDEHPARYDPVNAGEWLRAKVLGSRALQLNATDDIAVSGQEGVSS